MPPEGDDKKDKLPPDSEEEEEDGDEEEDEEEEEDEALAKAEADRLAAEKEATKAALRAEVKAEMEGGTQAAAEASAAEARQTRLQGSYGRTIATVRDSIKAHEVEVEGTEGKVKLKLGSLLSDDQVNKLVTEHVDKYNEDVLEVQGIQLANDLAAEAKKSLPKEVYDEFVKKVGGKEMSVWLKEYGERYAEHSEWAKTTKAAHDLEKTAQYGRGMRVGRGLDPEQPSTQGADGKSAKKTFKQLEAGYGAGNLTAAEDAEYNRLLAERQKSA